MSENVTIFGDIADDFDALVAHDEKLLDNWVDESGYSLGSMALASTAKAFMTFSKGFVDVGRIGNGVLIEGGVKGVGKDALRALTIVGGAGAVLGRASRILRIVQEGNTCVPMAQTNALRLSGQRFLITVEELAKKAGLDLKQIAISGRTADTYDKMVTAMQSMKIPVKTLASGSEMTADAALKIVRANPGGVVTFSIRTAANAQPHRLFATWSRLGGLVVRDSNYLTKVYRTLADLEKVWGAGAKVSGSPILYVPNTVLMSLSNAAATASGGFNLAHLAAQVFPVIHVPAGDAETALQTLTVREQLASAPDAQTGSTGSSSSASSASSGPIKGKYHTVGHGDWLSKLAQHYYGNMHKWPVIFAANRKLIGRDPNVIRVNQRLFIPDLPEARLISARQMVSQMMVA